MAESFKLNLSLNSMAEQVSFPRSCQPYKKGAEFSAATDRKKKKSFRFSLNGHPTYPREQNKQASSSTTPNLHAFTMASSSTDMSLSTYNVAAAGYLGYPPELIMTIIEKWCHHCRLVGDHDFPQHSPDPQQRNARSGELTLSPISKTCRYLRGVVQPMLFHYITSANLWDHQKALTFFTRTILSRKDLAKSVRSISYNAEAFSPENCPPGTKPKVVNATIKRALSLTENLKLLEIKKATTAILSDLAPDERFKMALPELKRLRVQWALKKDRAQMSDLAGVLSIAPGLVCLQLEYCMGVAPSFWEPQSTLRQLGHLQQLEFYQSVLTIDEVAAVLNHTSCLETFVWLSNVGSFRGKTSLSAQEFGEVLAELEVALPVLKVLILEFPPAGEDALDFGLLRSLTYLTRLEHLAVGPECFSDSWRLTLALPTTLRKLEFFRIHAEDVEEPPLPLLLLVDLAKDLGKKKKKSTLPNLKEITMQIVFTEDAWETSQSHLDWQPLWQLPDRFAQLGIKFAFDVPRGLLATCLSKYRTRRFSNRDIPADEE